MSNYILVADQSRSHSPVRGLGDILPDTSSLIFYGLAAFAAYHFLWEGRGHKRKDYKASLSSVGRGAARGGRAIGGYAAKRYRARRDSAHYGRL